ncbi:hypothetical protein B0H19DRAFT_1055246 [Mycena capillaripes]|nr:hypothetical protein B0H19DRAFT_1055246 [Mycena capillaripes]
MCLTAESGSSPLGFHERHFMRALVQSDYNENTYSIYEQQAEVMANQPASEGLLVTLFDYTSTPVQISVHHVVDSLVADILNTTGSDQEPRAQLHVMKVPEGSSNTRYWVVPLRTNSSRIHDALVQLARTLPADYDEEYIADGVELICDRADSEGLVEIH